MLLVGESPVHRTYYDILSVKEDAMYEEIRASYKSAILDSHPDKLQGIVETSDNHHELQERFLNVQKAWETLSDSSSRALYDHELRASRQDTETAEDVSLEDMTVEDVGETLELIYHCRCGDYFIVDSTELAEMGYSLKKVESKLLLKRLDALSSCVIIPCGSCSLKIRLMVDTNLHGACTLLRPSQLGIMLALITLYGLLLVKENLQLNLHTRYFFSAFDPMSGIPGYANRKNILAHIWSAPRPFKAQMFLWKLFMHCLSTAQDLVAHLMQVSTQCAFCNCNEETSLHLLVKWPIILPCWQSNQFFKHLPIHRINSIEDLFTRIMNMDSKDRKNCRKKFINAAIALWAIWLSRNSQKFEKKKFSFGNFIALQNYLQEFWLDHQEVDNFIHEYDSYFDRPVLPNDSWKSFFVNASFIHDNLPSTYGCVYIEQCKVLDNIDFIPSCSLGAEMVAFEHALKWAKDKD